jgi:hypothetical protein
MNELEQYVQWIASRVDREEIPLEEPDLEIKSEYGPQLLGNDGPWQIADLLASLSNDVQIDGFRSLVIGPSKNLKRPTWLQDESQLRDKLLRHFDGGVLPRVELLRREISDQRSFDALVVVDRQSPPYVTRFKPGGPWVVRVRTNTSRRTATRAELVELARGRRSTSPVRRLDVRVAPWGRGTRKIVVTNTGTVPVKEISAIFPEDAHSHRLPNTPAQIPLLNPGEKDTIPIMVGMSMNSRLATSERVHIRGLAEDGESVSTSVLVSDLD